MSAETSLANLSVYWISHRAKIYTSFISRFSHYLQLTSCFSHFFLSTHLPKLLCCCLLSVTQLTFTWSNSATGTLEKGLKVNKMVIFFKSKFLFLNLFCWLWISKYYLGCYLMVIDLMHFLWYFFTWQGLKLFSKNMFFFFDAFALFQVHQKGRAAKLKINLQD